MRDVYNKIAYILIYLTNSIKIYFICIWHKYFFISWVALLQPIVLNMINIDTLIIRHSSYVTLTCDVIAVIIRSYCLQARQVQFYKTPIRQDTKSIAIHKQGHYVHWFLDCWSILWLNSSKSVYQSWTSLKITLKSTSTRTHAKYWFVD